MTEPINLNKARKDRLKAAAVARAAENRIRFGRPKSETSVESAKAARVAATLDGHKRES